MSRLPRMWLLRPALFAVTFTAACGAAGSPRPQAAMDLEGGRLPTGQRLDPAAPGIDVGSFPVSMVLSPDGRDIALLLSGWREQGLQVVDRDRGRIVQDLRQPAAFLGLAFSPDGHELYASGGNQDVVYRYAWAAGAATLRDSVPLAPVDTSALPNPSAPGETRTPGTRAGRRYPAGLALSPDGRTLYVAENLSDDLAVIDVDGGRVTQRLPTERYPYGVAVAPDGTVYVSAWGGHTVSFFHPTGQARLSDGGRLLVGRHPSALLLSRDGSRLYVALATTDGVAEIDTGSGRVLRLFSDAAPGGPHEGTTPDAMALSDDGRRLFVAEADANAVAVFDDLSDARASGPIGRIPTGWYPTAVATRGDRLLVLNGKGRGSGPNVAGPQPNKPREGAPREYTLGQISGTLMSVAAVHADAAQLARWSARVERANGWDHAQARASSAYPPFRHVVYIIKENRTYDQVFGDLVGADSDTSLVYFPRAVSPNHHALAERFGVFDRFFVNAEVSPDGHDWSTAAYTSDYGEKTIPSNYSRRGRSYDYEGTNRDSIRYGDDDVNSPSTGYLWDAAQRRGISYRDYGEYVVADPAAGPGRYRGNKEALIGHTDPLYPGFDMGIPDQHRADEWLRELREFERTGDLPALEIVRLPNDHTAGLRAGSPTPRAYVADNDVALGRMIEALSNSRFWPSTVVFVLEDDAQNGPDHVDSHRSPLLVISPYSRGGVQHRFANTTDVLATIAEILGLDNLSQFDYYGRPLRDVFRATPDLRPYSALAPAISLSERNPRAGVGARESRRLDLSREDAADEVLFSHILWKAAKGDRPYPGVRRAPVLELSGAR